MTSAGGATLATAMPPSWHQFLDEVDRAIVRTGSWSGEARDVRDAAGRKRLGAAGGRKLVAALEEAGFEVEVEFDAPPRFESEMVIIRRAGAGDLAKAIEGLLPSIREADKSVPLNAMWRDAVVARTAVRAWRGRRKDE
jgi:hypothetical protein